MWMPCATGSPYNSVRYLETRVVTVFEVNAVKVNFVEIKVSMRTMC